MNLLGMIKIRITREDVAKKAGVSPATVSYILNNSRKFSDRTVTRVMNAVSELNYKPDMIAKSMVTRRTHQIAVVMDNLLNTYYGEIALAFEKAAMEEGYFVNICSGSINLDAYFEFFITHRIDGAMILALPDKYHINNLYNLVDSGTKIIIGGIDDIDLKRVSLIDNNYGEGMLLAMEHLYSLGHRQIFYLSSLPGGEQYDFRYTNFLKFQKERLNNNGENYVVTLGKSYYNGIDSGVSLMQKLLKMQRPFTAVVCSNDLLAMGAIKALYSAGLRVPQDISVVGFDNIMYGSCWLPPITSVTHDKADFGRKAFNILNESIQSNITGFYKADVKLAAGKSTAYVNETTLKY